MKYFLKWGSLQILLHFSVFERYKINLDFNIELEIDGETVETVSDFIFWAPKSLQMMTTAMKLKDAYSLEGKL